jgi:hypothetical protein
LTRNGQLFFRRHPPVVTRSEPVWRYLSISNFGEQAMKAQREAVTGMPAGIDLDAPPGRIQDRGIPIFIRPDALPIEPTRTPGVGIWKVAGPGSVERPARAAASPPSSGPPVQVAASGSESIDERWQHAVHDAAEVWRHLSLTELLGTGGHRVKLASLIRDRYGIARAHADRQVDNFFIRHRL